jgi:FkbM family methyltransferase
MKNIDLREFRGKDILVLLKKADELFIGNLEEKIHSHKIYNNLLEQIPIDYENIKLRELRGILRQKIWNCERSFFWNENFASQSGQDKIIKNSFFRSKKNGYFVEIGAFDGVLGSNCIHFEKSMNWEGIAIEPSKIQFEKLSKNRNCKVLNAAISSTEKDVEFMEVIEGLTQMSGINDDNYSAKSIIENNKNTKFNKNKIKTSTFEKSILIKEIDYLSIDIEGAELDVLKSINFQEYIVKVISVENNNPEKINFNSFLKENNFSFFDRVGQDEIFYNNKFFKLN